MMHASGLDSARRVGRKKQIPLDEEELKRARSDRCGLCPGGPSVATDPGVFVAALTLVVDFPSEKRRRHTRSEVGQMEKATGDHDRESPVAI